MTNYLIRFGAVVAMLLLGSSCNQANTPVAANLAAEHTDSPQPSDFAPAGVAFNAPRPRQAASMKISFVRNLSESVQISELRFSFWSTDAVGTPVYYGNQLIKCPKKGEAACSAKDFSVVISAGRLCRSADASKPGQTFSCDFAPAPKSQVQVISEWKDAVTGEPHQQVDRKPMPG